MIFIPVGLFFAALAIYFLYKKFKPQWDRQKILEKSQHQIPRFQDAILKSEWSTDHLNEAQLKRLCEKALIFYHEKKWTSSFIEEQKLEESIKACLPVVNRETNYYPSVRTLENPRPLREWLIFHQRQFSVERSKAELKELKGDFCLLGEDFFRDPHQFRKDQPQAYEILNSYFQHFSIS